MPKFYYLAVSSADNRRMNGQIDAATEASARNELNRMGLSILSISDQPPAKGSATNTAVFEFEALDRTQKKVNGTIDAADAAAAYERLKSEFKFQVSYVCRADASATEKEKARVDGIEAIKAAATKKEAEEAEAAKKNIGKSISGFVKKAEEKIQNVTSDTRKQSGITPMETPNRKEEEKEDVKQVAPSPAASEKAKKHALTLDDTSLIEQKEVATHTDEFSKNDFQKASYAAKPIAEEKIDISKEQKDLTPATPSQADKMIEKTSAFSKGISDGISTLANTVTKTIQPEEKTGEASAQLMAKDLLSTITTALRDLSKKLGLRSAYIFGVELLNALIVFYTTSFVLLRIATGYDLGSLSSFANQIVTGSTLLAFWAFVFILARILLYMQQQFHEHATVRASLMYGIAALGITFAGVNLL